MPCTASTYSDLEVWLCGRARPVSCVDLQRCLAWLTQGQNVTPTGQVNVPKDGAVLEDHLPVKALVTSKADIKHM
jgi:hypothetical protein